MLKKIFNKIIGRPSEVMSFQTAFDLTNMPIVTFHQGDKKFNFLLDTGSNSCVIDKSVLNKIEHEVIPNDDEVIGIEGNKKAVKACVITLYFNKKGYTYKYLINDLGKAFTYIKKNSGVTLHGILGSEFFNEFRYVLDFAELVAYSKP